jgi:ElaB/YqjD/DUF883 family membrane-anchored ribosome-binding protein
MSDTDSVAAEPVGTEERISEFAQAAAKAAEETVDRLEEKLKVLEDRARKAATEAEVFGNDLVTETEKRVRDNPLQAILTALGIGFLLGVLFGVGRGR